MPTAYPTADQNATMSPALIAATTSARFSTRPNRKRRTALRQSLRRIATAAALAAAALAAAAAWTSATAASARWTDDATAAGVGYIVHGTSCTLGDIDAAPRAVRDAAWRKWTARAVAAASAPSRDRNPAASARVLDFARGHVDTVDHQDLMDASLSAVRAAIDSGRLD